MIEILIDLLSENYFIVIYFITLVIGLVRYKSYFDSELKYYPIIIAYTFLNELLGVLVRYSDDFTFFQDTRYNTYNDVIYNIYSIVFFAFFYIVYARLISNPIFKNWIKRAGILVTVVYIISLFYQNPLDTNLFYAQAMGSWGLLFCIGLYFFDKKQKNEKLYQPYNLVFWISCGLIIFYSIFPILFLVGYLDFDTWEKYNFKAVLKILIVLMHFLIIIGFIKGRRRKLC